MIRFRGALFILMVVILQSLSVSAQWQGQITGVLTDNIVTFTGYSLPANAEVLVSRTFQGSCMDPDFQNRSIGQTSNIGNLVYTNEVLCAGVYEYRFTIGSLLYPVQIQYVRPAPNLADLPRGCGSKNLIQLGSLVQPTRDVAFWMLPTTGATSNNGNPLRTITSGVQVRVIDGPVCNADGIWWRVDYRFTFGEGIPSQNIGWIRESAKGVTQLAVVANSTVELPNVVTLSTTIPQATSLLSVQGIKMRSAPSVKDGESVRVDALKTGDGPVTILGQNGNGAFIQVQKGAIVGWICTHLADTNVIELNIDLPVTDESMNECFVK